MFQLDLSGGFSSLVAAVRGGRTVEVLGGLHLGEVELPPALAGKTLAEADLRREFGLEVVLIQSSNESDEALDGRPGKVPTPEVALQPGDKLLVMGTIDAIGRLREFQRE